MSASHRLKGKKFGRLTVVSVMQRTGNNRMVVCRCDCGLDGVKISITSAARTPGVHRATAEKILQEAP